VEELDAVRNLCDLKGTGLIFQIFDSKHPVRASLIRTSRLTGNEKAA
jgi:hypothetical protein